MNEKMLKHKLLLVSLCIFIISLIIFLFLFLSKKQDEVVIYYPESRIQYLEKVYSELISSSSITVDQGDGFDFPSLSFIGINGSNLDLELRNNDTMQIDWGYQGVYLGNNITNFDKNLIDYVNPEQPWQYIVLVNETTSITKYERIGELNGVNSFIFVNSQKEWKDIYDLSFKQSSSNDRQFSTIYKIDNYLGVETALRIDTYLFLYTQEYPMGVITTIYDISNMSEEAIDDIVYKEEYLLKQDDLQDLPYLPIWKELDQIEKDKYLESVGIQ